MTNTPKAILTHLITAIFTISQVLATGAPALAQTHLVTPTGSYVPVTTADRVNAGPGAEGEGSSWGDDWGSGPLSSPDVEVRANESIQQAINRANEGDVIVVPPGVHDKDVNIILKKNQKLVGQPDTQGNKPEIRMSGYVYMAEGSSIEDLKITRKNNLSALIYAPPAATNTSIVGIEMDHGYLYINSTGNTIQNNTIVRDNGTTMYLYEGNNLVVGNVFHAKNRSYGTVVSVYSRQTGGNIFDLNTVVATPPSGNQTVYTYGIYFYNGGTNNPDQIYNTIVAGTRYGVSSAGPPVEVNYSLIESNMNLGPVNFFEGVIRGVDPLLNDPLNGDYGLQPGSQAIGNGWGTKPDGSRLDIGARQTRSSSSVLPFSFTALVEHIQNVLHPNVTSPLQIQPVITPDHLTAAIAIEFQGTSVTYHLYIYSSTTDANGNPIQLMHYQGDGGTVHERIHKVDVDDTGKVVFIQRSPPGANLRTYLDIFELGASTPIKSIEYQPLCISGHGCVNNQGAVQIVDHPGSQVSVEVYPHAGEAPAGTKLDLDATASGIQILGEDNLFIPEDTLNSLPTIGRNDNYVVEEKSSAPGSITFRTNYHIYTPDGDLITTIIKNISFLAATSAQSIASLAFPDSSDDGEHIIHAYEGWCTRSSTGCVRKQFLGIWSGVDGSQRHVIELRTPLEDRVTAAEFDENESHVVIVTYASGDQVAYDARTGEQLGPPLPQGWTRAASNPNFAFRVIPAGIQGLNVDLEMIDLRDPERVLIVGGGSRVRHAPARYDVSPDGSVLVVTHHESGPAVGNLSNFAIFRVADLVEGEQPYNGTQLQNAWLHQYATVTREIRFEGDELILEVTQRGSSSQPTVDRTLRFSITQINSGELPVPAGWTRANSNRNFALRVECISPSSGGPGACENSSRPVFQLQVLNLVTGQQSVVATSEPSSSTDNTLYRFTSQYDVSPNGEYVVYESKANPYFGQKFAVHVQSIANSNQKITLTEQAGEADSTLETISFGSNSVTLGQRLSYGYSGTVMIKTVDVFLSSLAAGEASWNMINRGTGLVSHHPLGLLVQPEYFPRAFHVRIFDSSNGENNMRLIQNETLSDSGIYPSNDNEITLVDIRSSQNGRDVVSVGVKSTDPSNQETRYVSSLLIDPRDGTSLRLDGAVKNITIEGPRARYLVENLDGQLEAIYVDLETLTIITEWPVPPGWTRAESNPNFAFRQRQISSTIILELMDLEKNFMGAPNAVQTLTGLTNTNPNQVGYISQVRDVSPDGKTVVFGIDSPTHPSGGNATVQNIASGSLSKSVSGRLTRVSFYQEGDLLLYTENYLSSHRFEKFSTINPQIMVTTRTAYAPLNPESPNLHIDQDSNIVIAAGLNASRGFEITVLDSTECLGCLKIIDRFGLGADSGGDYTFLDAYTTSSGRKIVSVGIDADHFNSGFVIDVNSGKQVRLPGAIQHATYSQGNPDFANYNVVRQNGRLDSLVVNLETFEVEPFIIRAGQFIQDVETAEGPKKIYRYHNRGNDFLVVYNPENLEVDSYSVQGFTNSQNIRAVSPDGKTMVVRNIGAIHIIPLVAGISKQQTTNPSGAGTEIILVEYKDESRIVFLYNNNRQFEYNLNTRQWTEVREVPQGAIQTASNPNFYYTIESIDFTLGSHNLHQDNLTIYERKADGTVLRYLVQEFKTQLLLSRTVEEPVDVSPSGEVVVYNLNDQPRIETLRPRSGRNIYDGKNGRIERISFTAHNDVVLDVYSFDAVTINLDSLRDFSYGAYQGLRPEVIASPNGRYRVKDERPIGRLLVADTQASIGGTKELVFDITEAPILYYSVTNDGIFYVTGHDATPTVVYVTFEDIYGQSSVTVPNSAKQVLNLSVAPAADRRAVQLVAGEPKANITDANGVTTLVDLITNPNSMKGNNPVQFNFLDSNNDGTLSVQEIRTRPLVILNYLNRTGGGRVIPGTENEEYDINQDGFVTSIDVLLLVNFIGRVKNTPNNDAIDENLRVRIIISEIYDSNRDGKVTIEEIRDNTFAQQIVNYLNRGTDGSYVPGSPEASFDVNGDGTISSYDALLVINFPGYLRETPNNPFMDEAERRIYNVVDILDTNNDTKFSYNEMIRYYYDHLSPAWGKRRGQIGYREELDINGDGVINSTDWSQVINLYYGRFRM